MQDKRLFINGVEMQLSDRTKIGVNLQANNIGELQNRQGTFTNTFRLPLNAHNREQLQHANVMTSTSQLPYQKLSITYQEGGIEIMSNAEGIIKNADEDWIYIDAVGGNIDLVRAIGDTTVGELFVNDTPHVWNITNVVNSRDKSEYYIYPLIDWRTDKTQFFDTPTINVREMLPCCPATSIFERLETFTGYTFTGSYIESAEHDNMVITPDEFSQNPEYINDLVLKAENPLLSITEVEVLEGAGYITPQDVTVQMTSNDTNFFLGSYYPPTNEVGNLRWTGTFATRQVYINGGLGFLETPQTREFWFVAQIKKASTVIAEFTSNHFVGTVFDLDSFAETVIDIETGDIVLEAGFQYFLNIEIHAERHSNADTQIEFGFTNNISVFKRTPKDGLIYGNEIRFVDLFRMKTVDVLKDILNLRGLIIQTNSYTKEVSFNFFSDLIKNKAIALDWSSLVDVRQTNLFFKFGKYGQRNNFKFKEEDTVSSGLGDYYFDIDDETLESEVDAVKLNHSATQSKAKYQGRVIPEIEAITTDLNVWEKPGWRILQLDRQPTSYNVNYVVPPLSTAVNTSIPFCRFVGFDQLVPTYYGALIDILTNTKALILIVKLDPMKIQNLDFTIPIELNVPELDISGFFYINKISNYQGGLTLCDFVRL